MTQTEILVKYARLIIKTGVNLEKNQTLVINTPIESAPFARLLAETAYQEGAREVVMNWKDELSAKIRFQHAAPEVFAEFPDWQRDFYLSYVRQGASFISIAASDPELLKDIDPTRIAAAQKASSTALHEYREKLMSNHNTWCVVSVPTQAWAQKVFPALDAPAAIAALWDLILRVVRADAPDPVAAWEQHKKALQQRLAFLNGHAFDKLIYRNERGTNLTVELPPGHVWLGGAEHTPAGREFVANMPTEEVFTLPKKDGVYGTVVSSKPLNYHGNLIDDFTLTFEHGKIVNFTAGKGYETLKHLLATDDGASYLGEVALVPFASPISNANVLFYNTLFDENAACHFAFGKAYPVCLAGSETMSAEERAAAGINDSLIHEDFMIGTADLEIIGIKADGTPVPVFHNGNFAF